MNRMVDKEGIRIESDDKYREILIRFKNDDSEDGNYKCLVCGKEYSELSETNGHINAQNGMFVNIIGSVCSECQSLTYRFLKEIINMSIKNKENNESMLKNNECVENGTLRS